MIHCYIFLGLFFSLVFPCGYVYMPLSLPICTVWMQVYLKTREGFNSLGAGVASGCELPNGYNFFFISPHTRN